MKVVMVLAPGALDLKQTDKMEKPIKWIPPPTMYQKLPEIPYCSIIVELPGSCLCQDLIQSVWSLYCTNGGLIKTCNHIVTNLPF